MRVEPPRASAALVAPPALPGAGSVRRHYIIVMRAMAVESATEQRIARLTPLAEVLARIDELVKPVAARASDRNAASGRVLADDIVALSEQGEILRVRPAYPQLRLWPESVAFLYGSSDALPS